MRQRLRLEILARDQEKCQVCFIQDLMPNIHHIIPRKHGGTDDPKNLILLCSSCHGMVEHGSVAYWGKKCLQKKGISVVQFYNRLDELKLPPYWDKVKVKFR